MLRVAGLRRARAVVPVSVRAGGGVCTSRFPQASDRHRLSLTSNVQTPVAPYIQVTELGPCSTVRYASTTAAQATKTAAVPPPLVDSHRKGPSERSHGVHAKSAKRSTLTDSVSPSGDGSTTSPALIPLFAERIRRAASAGEAHSLLAAFRGVTPSQAAIPAALSAALVQHLVSKGEIHAAVVHVVSSWLAAVNGGAGAGAGSSGSHSTALPAAAHASLSAVLAQTLPVPAQAGEIHASVLIPLLNGLALPAATATATGALDAHAAADVATALFLLLARGSSSSSGAARAPHVPAAVIDALFRVYLTHGPPASSLVVHLGTREGAPPALAHSASSSSSSSSSSSIVTRHAPDADLLAVDREIVMGATRAGPGSFLVLDPVRAALLWRARGGAVVAAGADTAAPPALASPPADHHPLLDLPVGSSPLLRLVAGVWRESACVLLYPHATLVTAPAALPPAARITGETLRRMFLLCANAVDVQHVMALAGHYRVPANGAAVVAGVSQAVAVGHVAGAYHILSWAASSETGRATLPEGHAALVQALSTAGAHVQAVAAFYSLVQSGHAVSGGAAAAALKSAAAAGFVKDVQAITAWLDSTRGAPPATITATARVSRWSSSITASATERAVAAHALSRAYAEALRSSTAAAASQEPGTTLTVPALPFTGLPAAAASPLSRAVLLSSATGATAASSSAQADGGADGAGAGFRATSLRALVAAFESLSKFGDADAVFALFAREASRVVALQQAKAAAAGGRATSGPSAVPAAADDAAIRPVRMTSQLADAAVHALCVCGDLAGAVAVARACLVMGARVGEGTFLHIIRNTWHKDDLVHAFTGLQLAVEAGVVPTASTEKALCSMVLVLARQGMPVEEAWWAYTAATQRQQQQGQQAQQKAGSTALPAVEGREIAALTAGSGGASTAADDGSAFLPASTAPSAVKATDVLSNDDNGGSSKQRVPAATSSAPARPPSAYLDRNLAQASLAVLSGKEPQAKQQKQQHHSLTEAAYTARTVTNAIIRWLLQQMQVTVETERTLKGQPMTHGVADGAASVIAARAATATAAAADDDLDLDSSSAALEDDESNFFNVAREMLVLNLLDWPISAQLAALRVQLDGAVLERARTAARLPQVQAKLRQGGAAAAPATAATPAASVQEAVDSSSSYFELLARLPPSAARVLQGNSGTAPAEAEAAALPVTSFGPRKLWRGSLPPAAQ